MLSQTVSKNGSKTGDLKYINSELWNPRQLNRVQIHPIWSQKRRAHTHLQRSVAQSEGIGIRAIVHRNLKKKDYCPLRFYFLRSFYSWIRWQTFFFLSGLHPHCHSLLSYSDFVQFCLYYSTVSMYPWGKNLSSINKEKLAYWARNPGCAIDSDYYTIRFL